MCPEQSGSQWFLWAGPFNSSGWVHGIACVPGLLWKVQVLVSVQLFLDRLGSPSALDADQPGRSREGIRSAGTFGGSCGLHDLLAYLTDLQLQAHFGREDVGVPRLECSSGLGYRGTWTIWKMHLWIRVTRLLCWCIRWGCTDEGLDSGNDHIGAHNDILYYISITYTNAADDTESQMVFILQTSCKQHSRLHLGPKTKTFCETTVLPSKLD